MIFLDIVVIIVVLHTNLNNSLNMVVEFYYYYFCSGNERITCQNVILSSQGSDCHIRIQNVIAEYHTFDSTAVLNARRHFQEL